MAHNWTLRRRLFVGLLVLFCLSAAAITVAQSSTRAVDVEIGRVERLAEESRALTRVGALFREYYMHQAHLALGMEPAEHLALTRAARKTLGEALTNLDALPEPAVADRLVPTLRTHLETIDNLFEREFLPALNAGMTEHAAHVHHKAAGTVQEVTTRLEAEEDTLSQRISAARVRATEASARATMVSAVAVGGALVLALLVATGMARGITRPVALLRAAAEALPRTGAGRVPEDGPPELAALARTLNGTLAELTMQREARAEAETLAALGRIAAGVAHEINNPLGVILGHARLIERQHGDAALDARAIADETRRCQQIVQDLLDYARPGPGARESVDLCELCREEAERAGARLELPDRIVHVEADPRRLRSVLRNLLGNAGHFAEDVELRLTFSAAGATPTGGEVRVEVNDNGPGVPAADVERVFEPFFTTRPDGTGLGLAIARAVAVAHGGSLRAQPGPGGRFTLQLPRGAEV